MAKSDDAKRESTRDYNRDYKRRRRLDPDFQSKEREINRLAWRRARSSDARSQDRARRNEAFQRLRSSGMSCPKIAALLGVSISTVGRNTSSRATPEDPGNPRKG